MLRLTTRFANARGIFLVQQVPLAFRNKPSDFLALRRHWIAGESKGNDLDMNRLGFLAMNKAAPSRRLVFPALSRNLACGAAIRQR
jgi:hypothetical protein